MAEDWPDTEALKLVLNADMQGTGWDATLEATMSSAIERVKSEMAPWDPYEDEPPNDRLYMAALRMGEMMARRPEADPAELRQDPAYRNYLYGQRRTFGGIS
jgi:hypothetical protein